MYPGQSIQTAINSAGIGDTIYVHAGTYFENVNVNKRLTLIGVGKPVVDAGGNGSAITLFHDGIVLDGFTAINASYSREAGILVYSHNNIVINNTVSNVWGIWLKSASNNTLTGNTASNNSFGVLLESASNNNLTNNTASNNSYGILLESSDNNTLMGNVANLNGKIVNNTVPNYFGIMLKVSSNNTLTDNTASNNTLGINLESSSNNTLTDNTVSNSDYGIYLFGSSNTAITGNTASNNYYGIYLYSSSNNSVIDNSFSNNGLIVESSYHNIVINNTVNGEPLVYLEDAADKTINAAGQAILVNCDNITVNNLDVSHATVGIEFWNTNNSKIVNNTASNNNRGIWLVSSSNNSLTSNTVSNSDYGIYLFGSSNTAVTGNTASNNGRGIWLFISSNNTLTGNTASNNSYGFYLVFSSNNRVMDNSFLNNGLFVWYFDHNIVVNNTVNGKPLVYLEDVADKTITVAGQAILVNCDNITVNNLDVSHATVGIEFWNTNNGKIVNNTVSNNSYGIYLFSSLNNSITGNTALNNYHGIWLHPFSNNNHIYNNYFDNAINAYDSGSNIWNLSKTLGKNIIGSPNLGGNHWSDYNGTDINGDGLGDSPYDISGGTNKDYLPLVVTPHIFDTCKGDLPSISGTHNGTITPSYDINVTRLYTYPCPGTGGHTEYVKIWQGLTPIAEKIWCGYLGDWHNISFDESFTLYANETYNYTIRTGSYPHIIHKPSHNATGGVITCTEFVDINGNRHEGWIPAIKLF